jgi:hypothetical protein
MAMSAMEICSPLRGMGVDLCRFRQQIVRGVALRGEHHHHVVPLAECVGDDARHAVDLRGIGHRTAAEFLHNEHSKNLR